MWEKKPEKKNQCSHGGKAIIVCAMGESILTSKELTLEHLQCYKMANE